MKFELTLCIARMVNAVLATLPLTGGAAVLMDDWRTLAVGALTAALGALRTDIDSWIAAKTQAAEEAKKEVAKKALEAAEQRLPDGAIVVQEAVPALVSMPAAGPAVVSVGAPAAPTQVVTT